MVNLVDQPARLCIIAHAARLGSVEDILANRLDKEVGPRIIALGQIIVDGKDGLRLAAVDLPIAPAHLAQR